VLLCGFALLEGAIVLGVVTEFARVRAAWPSIALAGSVYIATAPRYLRPPTCRRSRGNDVDEQPAFDRLRLQVMIGNPQVSRTDVRTFLHDAMAIHLRPWEGDACLSVRHSARAPCAATCAATFGLRMTPHDAP
jgi:hypothetical protein